MKYLLDTNVCIQYLRGRLINIAHELHDKHPAQIFVCSVVKAELYYGAMRSQYPEANLVQQNIFLQRFISLPFDDKTALVFGQLRADLSRRGTPIGPYDLQIAAIALAHDCILVTHNTAEFSRVEGLRLEDWETPRTPGSSLL